MCILCGENSSLGNPRPHPSLCVVQVALGSLPYMPLSLAHADSLVILRLEESVEPIVKSFLWSDYNLLMTVSLSFRVRVYDIPSGEILASFGVQVSMNMFPPFILSLSPLSLTFFSLFGVHFWSSGRTVMHPSLQDASDKFLTWRLAHQRSHRLADSGLEYGFCLEDRWFLRLGFPHTHCCLLILWME